VAVGSDIILVAGMGSEARQDDGVGLEVVRALAGQSLPSNVRLLEGGTNGFALLGHLEGVRRLVLVDAMSMGQPVGAVVTVRPEQVRSLAARESLSGHGVDLLQILDLAAALGLRPEVYIVGVQPEQVGLGFGLAPAIQEALPRVIDAVRRVAWAESPQDLGERSAVQSAQGESLARCPA
jgi:hydrogenase maturation protease